MKWNKLLIFFVGIEVAIIGKNIVCYEKLIGKLCNYVSLSGWYREIISKVECFNSAIYYVMPLLDNSSIENIMLYKYWITIPLHNTTVIQIELSRKRHRETTT